MRRNEWELSHHRIFEELRLAVAWSADGDMSAPASSGALGELSCEIRQPALRVEKGGQGLYGLADIFQLLQLDKAVAILCLQEVGR